MMNHSRISYSRVLSLSLVLLSSPLHAQAPTDQRAATIDWISNSLHEISNADLDAPTDDLQPFSDMIGDARIIGLSESLHSAAEPMQFRNRLFKYLVEELDFKAIVLESGLVESRTLDDYVVDGEGNLESAVASGFSHGFEQFAANRELVRWLHDHNAGLPDNEPKVRIFGMDVSGSPGNLGAPRKMDTALQTVLAYLDDVDADVAAEFRARIETYLPVLASTNDYGVLIEAERNLLTSAIEDLISLIERRRFEYIRQKTEADYVWAERAAIAARQTDSWFRRMPDGWVLSDGLAWLSEAQIIRDRVMADNLDWVLDQLQPDDRVLVFASVSHIAATEWVPPDWMGTPAERSYVSTPFGAYARARYGDDYVNVFNMVSEGGIYFCQNPNRDLLTIGLADESWVESVFATPETDNYLIDLRAAPAQPAAWLQQVRDHRNVRASTSDAFDIAYYSRRITSDCVAQ